jgi:hypothetical protein
MNRLLILVGLLALPAARGNAAPPTAGPPAPWRGVHLMAPGHEGVALLTRVVDEALPPLGVNAVVLEVNYNFRYASHPEVAAPGGLTRDDARALAAACKAHGIRLIPQLNCLGHQSWRRNAAALLKAHPEFNETPDVDRVNDLYCLSWCPLHPGVNPLVFDLIDELADAFQADAFHVGMDEVFLIASEQCPRWRGKDPAELFARAVNDLHGHIVGTRKLTMLMWGDRLLDAKATGYSKWEASANGTAPAIDRVPRDLVICDWHYGRRDSYPSLQIFQDKGFRVWPSSWKDAAAAVALRDAARRAASDRMLGHLCTTWTNPGAVGHALLGEEVSGKGDARQVAEALRACFARP